MFKSITVILLSLFSLTTLGDNTWNIDLSMIVEGANNDESALNTKNIYELEITHTEPVVTDRVYVEETYTASFSKGRVTLTGDSFHIKVLSRFNDLSLNGFSPASLLLAGSPTDNKFTITASYTDSQAYNLDFENLYDSEVDNTIITFIESVLDTMRIYKINLTHNIPATIDNYMMKEQEVATFSNGRVDISGNGNRYVPIKKYKDLTFTGASTNPFTASGEQLNNTFNIDLFYDDLTVINLSYSMTNINPGTESSSSPGLNTFQRYRLDIEFPEHNNHVDTYYTEETTNTFAQNNQLDLTQSHNTISHTLTYNGPAFFPNNFAIQTQANTHNTVTIQGMAPNYTVTFSAGANGSVTGTTSQGVIHGGNTNTPVTAVPNSGFIFLRWSDGSQLNPRLIENVTDNLNIQAEFLALNGTLPTNFGLLSQTFTHDNVNRRNSVTLIDGLKWIYQYDALGNLKQAFKAHPSDPQQDLIFDYTYDDIGNRKTADENGNSKIYTANDIQQYTEVNDNGTVKTLTYDDAGNPDKIGDWDITWDGEDRARLFTNSITGVKIEFTYDFRGFTGSRKVLDSGDNVISHIGFLYDGNLVSDEIDILDNNKILRSYTWGLDPAGTKQQVGGIGALLAMEETQTDNSVKTFYVVSDAGGNVTNLVESHDDGSLTMANSYEYGPFGQVVSKTENVENPMGWNSKYTDSETGLVNQGFRFYDSDNGRWLNRDPIGVNGGINLYNSVSNNMVNGYNFIYGNLQVDSYGNATTMRKLAEPNLETIAQFSSLKHPDNTTAFYAGKYQLTTRIIFRNNKTFTHSGTANFTKKSIEEFWNKANKNQYSYVKVSSKDKKCHFYFELKFKVMIEDVNEKGQITNPLGNGHHVFGVEHEYPNAYLEDYYIKGYDYWDHVGSISGAAAAEVRRIVASDHWSWNKTPGTGPMDTDHLVRMSSLGDNNSYVAAHEYAHLLGLVDYYTDSGPKPGWGFEVLGQSKRGGQFGNVTLKEFFKVNKEKMSIIPDKLNGFKIDYSSVEFTNKILLDTGDVYIQKENYRGQK